MYVNSCFRICHLLRFPALQTESQIASFHCLTLQWLLIPSCPPWPRLPLARTHLDCSLLVIALATVSSLQLCLPLLSLSTFELQLVGDLWRCSWALELPCARSTRFNLYSQRLWCLRILCNLYYQHRRVNCWFVELLLYCSLWQLEQYFQLEHSLFFVKLHLLRYASVPCAFCWVWSCSRQVHRVAPCCQMSDKGCSPLSHP